MLSISHGTSMDLEELLSAICNRIDEFQQKMDARFDEIFQQKPQVVTYGNSNQQLAKVHPQFGSQEAPIGSLQGTNEPRFEVLQKSIKLGIEEPNEHQNLVDFSKGIVEMPSEILEIEPSSHEFLAKEHFSVGLSRQMKTNFGQIQNKLQGYHWETGDSRQEIDKDLKSPQIRYEFSTPTSIDFLQEPMKVNSNPVVVDCDAPEKMVVSVAELIDPGGISVGDLKGNPFEFLALSTAQQLFDKVPMRNSNDSDFSIHLLNNVPLLMGNWVFDPGDFTGLGIAKQMSFESEEILMMEIALGHENKTNSNQACRAFSWEMQDCVLVFNPGMLKLAGCDAMAEVSLESTSDSKASINTLVFVGCANWKTAFDYVKSLPFDDPGGLVLWSWANCGVFVKVVITMELCSRGKKAADFSFTVKGFVFDPGGSYLHQKGCLRLDGGCTEGLQLLRSIWLIAWSPRRCKLCCVFQNSMILYGKLFYRSCRFGLGKILLQSRNK